MIFRLASDKDVVDIFEIMNKVDLDKSIFIKSNIIEIKNRVKDLTFIAEEEGEVLGFVMLGQKGRFRYIDTIVSRKEGIGKYMLESLTKILEGHRVYVNISPRNEKSLGLFEGFGFKFICYEKVQGEERCLFCADWRY